MNRERAFAAVIRLAALLLLGGGLMASLPLVSSRDVVHGVPVWIFGALILGGSVFLSGAFVLGARMMQQDAERRNDPASARASTGPAPDAKELPTILARVAFLTPREGGRSFDVRDAPEYRPYLVVGSTEDYLAVRFAGDGRTLPAGRDHDVRMTLVYFDETDYSRLVPGATFTIREGPRVVGSGTVLEAASRRTIP